MVFEGGLRIKCNKWDQHYDMQVIFFFNLGPRKIKFQNIKICHRSPPCPSTFLFYCDGASVGNPGAAGFGVVVRDHNCQVIGTLTGGLGIATNYIVEVYDVACVVELAVMWKMRHIILNSDSKTVITEFARKSSMVHQDEVE
ncbi:uncharacterized protein LOC113360065 [Papaver somniferum]|uniref:uncharacterized protein LOC113360065 n=1 Tax=Papaver somniferum TaxID=3469 RepID=UPI000E70505D|nr:uncharacterized protein LOC113360065 [Papaver somniferum]